MANKMTKRDYFEQLKTIVLEDVTEGSLDADQAGELVAFLDGQMEQITAKAEKAKERAAAKQAEPDEIYDSLVRIFENIEDDAWVTAETLAAEIGTIDGEAVSRQKVTARLTKMVRAGMLEKETQTFEKRRLTVYRMAHDEVQ